MKLYFLKRSGRASRASGPIIADRLESRLHLAADPVQVSIAADAPPPVPFNVVVRPAGLNEHRVTWNDVVGETGYVVLRRKVGEANFADVATLPADTRVFVDTLNPAEFPAGTQLEYRVASSNDFGRSGTQFTPSILVGGPGGTGLRQRIWNDFDPATFEPTGAPAVDRIDGYVDHAWGDASPAAGIDPDTFAAEWVGEVYAEQTRPYDFSVIANDGVRLFLNDKLVIAGGWRDQADTEYFSEPLILNQGQRVKVRLQYYDNTGPATARLRWNGAGGREAIPSVFLFPTVAANDAVAEVPRRPVTFPEVFGLPAAGATPLSVAVRWQDNAFGESAYRIRRATNLRFTQNVVEFAAPSGSDEFIDRGGLDAQGNPAPLDGSTRYFYRVAPAATGDWVYAGVTLPRPYDPGYEFAIDGFPTQEFVTLNGAASTTAEGTLKLTHNQRSLSGSAFLNRVFAVDSPFRRLISDFRIGESNGGGGMAFVIHNAAPAAPGKAQIDALGGGGTAGFGYAGIGNSVAIILDAHPNLATIGVWTQGRVPTDVTWDDMPAAEKRDNSNPAGAPHAPNGQINLRDPANLPPGATPIDLDDGTRLRLWLEYDSTGVDANGNGFSDDADTGLLTIKLFDASNGFGPPLFTTEFAVDLETEVGGRNAVMGWTASTGDLSARHEVYNFTYLGYHGDQFTPDVYVRGSAWTPQFKQDLWSRELGDPAYGYFVRSFAASGLIPWMNIDEVVLRFVGGSGFGGGMPTTNYLTVRGRNGNYPVVSVSPVPGDPIAYVFKLGRPLGGGNLFTGAAPTAAENGDRVSFSNANFPNFASVNVLQGDVDHLGEGADAHRVLARDYTEVKKRFFKSTASPETDPDTDYSPFHDLDGNGQILARDYAEVKRRFFHALPPPLSPATAAAAAPLFADRRLRPGERANLALLQ